MTSDRDGLAQRSNCPIAGALDLLGDRWTLLVVRDLLFGKKTRFGDFLNSSERIPTNLLSERLRRLEAAGIVEKRPYQERPVRFEYLLTERGAGLSEVLLALIRWGGSNVSGTLQFSDQRLAELARAKLKRQPGEPQT